MSIEERLRSGLGRLGETAVSPDVDSELEQVVARGRLRRHRRRLTLAAAAMVPLVIGVGVLSWVATRNDNPSQRVTTRPKPRSETTTTPTTPIARQRWRVPGQASISVPAGGLSSDSGLVFRASGFAENGGGTVIAVNAATGKVRWKVTTPGPVFLRDAPVNGHLLIFGQYGYLASLDARTGQEQWRQEAKSGGGIGFPTVRGGVVYAGESYNREGDVTAPLVHAFDLATGRPTWQTTLAVGTDLIWSQPVVTRDTVLVETTVSHPGSAPNSFLHALDRATGRERWRFPKGPGQGFHSRPPLVDGDRVYFGSSGSVYGLSLADGHKLWERPSLGGIPIVIGSDPDRVLVVTEKECVSLDRATGAVQWRIGRSDPPAFALVVPRADVVDFATGETLREVTAAGDTRWTASTGSPLTSGGVDTDPLIRRGNAIIVSTRVDMVAFDSSNGKRSWEASVTASSEDQPIFVGDTLVLVAQGGDLVALDPPR